VKWLIENVDIYHLERRATYSVYKNSQGYTWDLVNRTTRSKVISIKRLGRSLKIPLQNYYGNIKLQRRLPKKQRYDHKYAEEVIEDKK
jgi:hypothetical protein